MNADINKCDGEFEMKSRSELKRQTVLSKRAALVAEELKQDNKISRLEQHSAKSSAMNELSKLGQENFKIKTTETLGSADPTINILAQILKQRENNRQRRHQERLQMYQTYQRKFLQQREKSIKIHQQFMEKLVQRFLDVPDNV